MEQVIIDEVEKEAASRTTLHVQYQDNVRHHAYDFLCRIHLAAEEHDLDVASTVTRSAMDDTLRDVNEEFRHSRDFIILRSFHSLAVHTHKTLSVFQTALSS